MNWADNILVQCSQTPTCTFSHRASTKMGWKSHNSWLGPGPHTCNPSHSGSGDWEHHGSKPAQAKS
jgi:hypothetical protein